MQKKFFYTAFLILVILTVVSCNGKIKPNENPKVYELDETPDTAMLVRLDDIEGDSLIVTPLDEFHKLAFDYSKAKASGQVKGSITVGDTLSIFPDNRKHEILLTINVSELSGRWFYDIAQHRGLIFEANGGMSTINAATMAYREWKLLNGKLYIYYVDMQQVADERHQYEVDEAKILHLDRENLELEFRNNHVKCQRQHGLIMFGKKK